MFQINILIIAATLFHCVNVNRIDLAFVSERESTTPHLNEAPCVSSYDGSAGFCRPYLSCPSAIAIINQKEVWFDICKFIGDEPIVCCVMNKKMSDISHDNLPRPDALRLKNEKCLSRYDGSKGTCQPLHTCQSAMAMLHERALLDICSVSWPEPIIVCCVSKKEPSQEGRDDFVPVSKTKMEKNKDVAPPNTSLHVPSGDPCIVKHDGSAGVCVQYSLCKQKTELSVSSVIRSDICGVVGKEPKICCPLKKRLSESMCEEYSNSVIGILSAMSVAANGKPVSSSAVLCSRQLVVGGEKAKIGEFPHMAAIGWTVPGRRVKWLCGGSLISESFILTAAHCTSYKDVPPDIVRLGEVNLQRSEDGAYSKDFSISTIFHHPDYKKTVLYHDVALLKLSKRVTFSLYIRPACLWQKSTLMANTSIVTGWGRTDNEGGTTDDLMKVIIGIVDNTDCATFYSDQKVYGLKHGIIDTQLCAGVSGENKDACKGDSGGPLQVIISTGKSCMYYVMGVTSFGRDCGRKTPGVYTRVNKYLDWIEKVVWANT